MPAGVLVAIALGGAAINTIGQIKAGNAAKKAGDLQLEAGKDAQGLENYNATVAEAKAQDALDTGAQQEQGYRASVRTLIGSQKAGFAGQGVDVGVGSAADVQADAAFLGELDALTIRTNAARDAWGFKVEAENARRRGEIDLKTGQYQQQGGQAAQTASRYGAASTILGTTSSLLQAKYGTGKR